MELEESNIEFKPVADARPTMPQPPPVRLVSVEDVHLSTAAGLEVELNDFYVELLKFERDPSERGALTFKAENFRLHFDVIEVPEIPRDQRATGIDVPSLRLIEKELISREIEFDKQRGIVPGQVVLYLQDPAGNWLQIGEIRAI